MRNICRITASSGGLAAILILAATAKAQTNNIANPLIDYPGFLTNAAKVETIRNQRRLTEQQFIDMASARDTIVFDARSDDKFQKLHIKGARHLSFPEITEVELAKVF